MSEAASIPPRPYGTDEVQDTAINAILNDVMEWRGADPSEVDRVREVLFSCADEDAYCFARALEDRLWDPDAELVGILGGYDIHGATKAAVQAWVIKHDVTVPFSIGDMVSYCCPFDGDITLRVVGIWADTAELVAQPVTPLPHEMIYGERDGRLIPAEQARLASPAAEASAPS